MDAAHIENQLAVNVYPYVVIAGEGEYHVIAVVHCAAVLINEGKLGDCAEVVVVFAQRHKLGTFVGSVIAYLQNVCLAVCGKLIVLAVVFVHSIANVVKRHLVGAYLLAITEQLAAFGVGYGEL